ncbi:uncharacterized protein Dana_GF22263, isoform K [Drosophila ananassae]|uniref:Uncharacterized protein, isoform K n=1 Tax=Drosophila ananassae TaxID=7217 RepID=A0A0P8ZHK3_DROAN|nr:smoothelin isoform X14 [Drosophila ananassae]KPU74184.1 uncharacterized protein Dana_GF22263, isoform K [Drosophila ananassae]
MEVESDLGDIQNEELLRKMWQQSEDSERKKQIRSHLYKLRESRLCNLYRHDPDPMSEPNGNGNGNGTSTLAGYGGKDPLATSHGDVLLDQNFQSLKSKEVRDSTSPTNELRFHSMSLTQPNTTGWDVQTSSEVSPDGRAYRTETLAKTDEKSSTTTTTTTTSTSGRSVANQRNVFEPTAPQETPEGRRPSYMDHTKSSLEHIRRDSLEINKSHYSRKSSVEDDSPAEPRNPNSAVKFDVPRKGSQEPRKPSLKGREDDSDLELEIEEIFDLQRLEQLLETVSSYEMRRRIRAQMRLIRKNMINAGSITSTTTVTTTSTSSSPGKSSPSPKRRDQSPLGSPESKTTSRTTTSSRKQRAEQVDSTTYCPGKVSPTGKPPVKPRERSASPAQKRRTSPPGKQSPVGGSTTTTTTKVTTTSTTRGAPGKPSQGPIWADRSKVLKGHAPISQTNGSTPRKGSTSSTTSTSTSGKITRTMTSSSSTTSSTTNSRSKQREEDSITSSYGVGPTDENGLPVFGLRALKKKSTPPADEPCETKQVTGYVIEEQFYSDNKSPPRHERKELIYSSNPEELAAIKQKLQDEDQDDGSVPQLDSRLVREFKKVEAQSQSLPPEDARYVRRGSVKELSEKFIRKESSSSTHSSTLMRNEDETEDDSESTEVCSVIEAPQMRQSHVSSSTRSSNTRSFLNASADERQVTSVDDVLERMRNADNVEEPGDSSEDREARALLNKFLGASVIMQGVESMLPPAATGQRLNSQGVKTTRITNTYSSSSKSGNSTTSTSNNKVSSSSSSAPVTRTTCDIEEIWDEQILKQLLEQASTYEERRKIRARLRELMAEREAAQHKSSSSSSEQRTETKSSKDGGNTVTTTTTKVTTRTVSGSAASKNISPLAKFKQLDKQAAAQQAQKSSPTTTSTPTTPGGSAQPLFKFTDPALNARAATVKDQLLQWCQHKTQEYENVQITNFSSSWSDGLAFCALIHHFLPDAFDFSKLTKQTRRHNFELAFSVADEKAGIAPLLDVEDMVEMSRPDWKCVFVYVQSIYRRFRNCQ